MQSKEEFIQYVLESFKRGSFVKAILSKPRPGQKELINIHIRGVEIKGQLQISFTYHYSTKDETKNYTPAEASEHISRYLNESFHICNLFTKDKVTTLAYSKKNKLKISSVQQSVKANIDKTHDRIKKKYVSQDEKYLKLLGVTDGRGGLIPKMASKFRQINKYLEIIESLIKDKKWQEPVNIVDMGSGKGYLTFALYDYLNNVYGLEAIVMGVELKRDLVDQCNEMAEECGFENLLFACESIQSYSKVASSIDILIALHACDTATDDAIYTGLSKKADLIVCAPCCHKQIRQQVKGKEQENPLMRHGIFQERELEMVTDTLRSLIMEKNNYKTKVFEFVSNEHTRKNVMLVGSKTENKGQTEKIQHDIDMLKQNYKVDSHYLEELITESN